LQQQTQQQQLVIELQAEKIKYLETELHDLRRLSARVEEVTELRRMFLELQTSMVAHTGKVLDVVTANMNRYPTRGNELGSQDLTGADTASAGNTKTLNINTRPAGK
jgi:hypothetical protein